MVQGKMKGVNPRLGKKTANRAAQMKAAAKIKAKTKKGNPCKGIAGKNRQLSGDTAKWEDKALTKAIASASEGKVSAKMLQSGKTLHVVKDALNKGKEINRDKRRAEVKKKVGRLEEKLNVLKNKESLRDQ